MSSTAINSQKLNAYVDNELSQDEAAEVARAAAGNPKIATQIAVLCEMKAAVIDMVPERTSRFAHGSAGKTEFPWRQICTVSASITVIAVSAVLYFLTVSTPAATRWAHLLQDHHQAWSFTKDGNSGLHQIAGGAAAHPVDLSSARLTVAGYEVINFSGSKAIRIGYRGTRGCRVSFFVIPEDVILEKKLFAPSLHVKLWKLSEYGYALVADGMPLDRFNQLAEAVEFALRSGQPLNSAARQRLADSRQASPPCRA